MSYFPYEHYREGQAELIEFIRSSLLNRHDLIIEAMSGFGKTVSVLSASLDIAEKLNLSVLYLCRTKREIDRVIEEAKKIQARRYFTFSFIISKSDLCFLYSNQKIDPYSISALCRYAVLNNFCSYWNNCNFLEPDSITKLFAEINNLSSYISQARNFHVCPYEITKRSLFSSKLIILTYNNLFQDVFSASSESLIQDPSRTIIILDEAHNLYDIISELHSFEIAEKDIENSISEAFRLGLIDLAKKMEQLLPFYNKICFLVDKISAHDRRLIKDEFRNFSLNEISILQNLLSKYIRMTTVSPFSKTPYVIKNFIKIYTFINYLLSYLKYENIMMLVENKNGFTALNFVNVDPSDQINTSLKKFWSYIMMSATVGSPKTYYSMLKLDASKTKFYYVEPQNFMQNSLVIVDKGITTKYKRRNQSMFNKIAKRIYTLSNSIPFNIGVFFPSYAVLSSTMEALSYYNFKRPFFKEAPKMSFSEASELCDRYKNNKTNGAVLFGVQGGRFSEGENFQNGEMRVVIVVGLSLPPPTKRLFLKMGYIKRAYSQNAFLIAMLDPAIKKAVQAAGRITRNTLPSIVFLLDSRFSSNLVLDMLPRWMKKNLVSTDLDESPLERILYNSFPIFMSNCTS